MFKLESYITPLLLNYVDKYIKNLKPEDSQFSLWGGDAVFSNLDLRLDVLEQELQLPFTFINGHIHELRIHIPWTKLGSEPVVITINTIECILKLCTNNNDEDSQKQTKKKKNIDSKSIKKTEVVEAPPGYVQSLINRVISNICIICNNVILKYVEEDIVLSLNIKSVELFNANEKWEKAFVDTNIADTIFRKVIYMQDLTVCLDKRDASGKIETYQDPLLYRCSSTWRMYSVYNSSHSKYPALTRIHMYCESLDFSLTDQQLPMFLKLVYLCIALHNKSSLKNQENGKGLEETTESNSCTSDEEQDETETVSHEASWGSWAWSFVPEVGVIWDSSGTEEEQEKEAQMLKSKKIFQFGVYIGKSTCILKHTALANDASCCMSPKCVFLPLMIVKMYGCSMEFTSKGKDFFNMQSGICGVTVTGLQDCVCGFQDCSDESNPMNVFLKSGVPPGSGHAYSFLSSSLFDPLAPENCKQERKYCFNWTEHFSTLTEEVMVKRYPAFAFDYLYQLDIPEDWLDRISTVTSSFIEDSNWHESATYRMVFGPFCVDVTSSLVHRLRKMLFSAQDYDYPYYAPYSKKTSITSVNVSDDVLEEMEGFVPLRQYHITLFKPVFRLSVADHSPYHDPKQDHRKKKKKRLKSTKYTKTHKYFEILFYIEIYADCVDLQTSSPLYPNRLIKIIESLSNPPQFLLHHCFNSTSLKIFGLEVSLHKVNSKMYPVSTILQQTSLTFLQKCLVLPDNWTSSKILTLQESTFECSSLNLKFSETDCLASVCIFQSWTAKYFNSRGVEKLKVAIDDSENDSPLLGVEVHGTHFLYLLRKDSISVKFSISSLSVMFQQEENSSILFKSPVSTEHLHKGIDCDEVDYPKCNENDCNSLFLQVLLQLPKDKENDNPVLLVIKIEGSTACFEPAFFNWMSSAFFTNINLDTSDLECVSASPVDREGTSTSSSLTQEASVSHSLSKSFSTIVVSEKQSSFHENVEYLLQKYWKYLSFLILEVEIRSLCGICPKNDWSIVHKENEPLLFSWQQALFNGHLDEACLFSFPTIKIRNNSSVSSILHDIDILQIPVPIKTVISEKKGESYFPWTLQLNSSSAYIIDRSQGLKYNFLLWPTTISATIALSLKSNQDQFALCVHMDNKSLNINFSAFQVSHLKNCFCNASSVLQFITRLNMWISFFKLKFIDNFDCPGSNIEFIDQEIFLEQPKVYETNSNCKKASHNEQDLESPEPKSFKKPTLWVQMTLSKLCVVILGKLTPNMKCEDFKLQLDAEEIVCSLDIQDIYSKIKIKLTSLNINCFIKRCESITDWQPAPYEGKILFCDNMMTKSVKSRTVNSSSGHVKPDNQPFLVFTYTKALHSNVTEKFSSDLKQSASPVGNFKYLSEIDLKVKSFGTVLWMSLFDILYQVSHPLIAMYISSFSNLVSECNDLKGIGFCGKNLPLFYIETNIIQIYLPENSTLTKELLNLSEEKDEAVVLLQLDCVTLTSQVENPLPRIILNHEIYSNALNSKTIGLPGASVEDRQYQIDICGLSLGTVSGTNVLCQNEIKKNFISHYPLTMGENPALEWNIGVVSENRSLEKDSTITTPIISPMNIRIAIAPAIVCDSSNKSFEKEEIVVAGISTEISVLSEPHSYLLCHPSSQKFESSCFDLQLYGASVENVLKKPNKSCTPIKDDFNYAYLETKPGEPHKKTGIPPAFFTVTCTDIFCEPANIKISVERPMKINLGVETGDSFIAFLKMFHNEFRRLNASEFETELSSEEKPSLGMLTYFKTSVLCTSQIVLQFTPFINNPTEKLILSASSLVIETNIETYNQVFKTLDLDLTISSFIIQTNSCNQVWNFLEPLMFTTEIKCHFMPCVQVEINLSGESLLLNFSIHQILNFKKLMEAVFALVQKNILSISDIFLSLKRVDQLNELDASLKDNKKRKYWNDDLRKGSFQFLQVNESSDFQPRSNEILFSRATTNQPASMTWCYPEPRALTKIEVSPVPFQNGDEEQNQNVITCYLQYWNSSYQEYVNFCDFTLSETKHLSLDLPDLNSDSIAVSNKWRVLLDSGSYINDGNLEKDNPDFSPLALAACMSIDSCFDPKLVPVFQTKISFELVKFIMYNSFVTQGCSPILLPFEFDDESLQIQEFTLLSFINPSCSFVKKICQINGEVSSGVTCEVLEYRNLTLLPVISPVDFNGRMSVNFDKEKVPIFDLDLVLSPLIVRLSQSICHTLIYTIHSISQELSGFKNTSKCFEYMLPNYYIICNNLEERIRFGQAGTEESIVLSPLKMHAYSWWSHKSKQVLWISIGSLGWKWSEQIDIDEEGIKTVAFSKNILAIVKITSLSNLQKQVIIDGQLILYSQLSFPIQLRCKFPDCLTKKTKSSNSFVIKSLAPQLSSPSFLLSSEQCKNMSLSVTGILDSQLWSEDIVLDDNKLLKIPWLENNHYQSVWCQVIKKKVLNVLSVAVFISPLFMIRSNLPLPLKVIVESDDTEENYTFELEGRGQEIKLFKGFNAETDLQVNFKSSTTTDVSLPALVVSLSDRNHVKMKEFADSEEFLKLCSSMQSINYKTWPYSFLEKFPKPLPILYPCFEENQTIASAIPSHNVNCKLKIERSQRWKGLNTILYDIKPHVILINRLRADLYLFAQNGLEWTLPSNSVAMPSFPYECFRLGILEDGEYFYSSGLAVDVKYTAKDELNREDAEKAFFCSDSTLRIPQNGSVNVFIKVQGDTQKVFLFKLHSEVQEDIVVITAFPQVILCNESNKSLYFSLRCIPSNSQTITFPDVSLSPVIVTDSLASCHPLLYWEASSFDVASLTNSTTMSLYVSVRHSSSQTWSYPVHLHPKFGNNNRHSISVPLKYDAKSTTIPLVMTSHWQNGILFLLLNIDPCPLLLLHNKTNMNIYYGQSCLEIEGKVEGKYVYEELQQFHAIPVLFPESSAHYSFPALQKQFPLVPKKASTLCFGLKEDGAEQFIWSAPFNANMDKQFIHILGICDFMVCSERVGHTINLYVEHVNRIEVNANEPFERENILTSHYEIGRMLVIHYFTGALFRAGWVVGSLDILGNPAGFARAVGAGMSDLVYLPYRGMLHGPRAFISGLTSGAISLFTQVSSGAITCMASLTSSISKNMDFLCLDDEHLARQELVRQHLPQGISEGLTQGLSVFGLSVLGAVAGIVDHPLRALVSPSTPLQTVSEIFGGFGKGIVGVFTKPIGGAAELISQAGYGLLHGAGWLVPPKRKYQPVTMNLEMASSSLVKYSCKIAFCQSLGQVLLAVEATYVNEYSEHKKYTLLLTSEALCILTEDEVTLHRTFALTEIQCKKAETDRSTLVIILCSTFQKQIFSESRDGLGRVAEYLKKNNEISSAADNLIESLNKSNSIYHIYFLYPKDRNLFVTLFNYAKCKALRKGF
ncbi:hypothetical protein JTE90_026471 [Oedothorax gibbosus]|uniref:Chorein N-terminal domain-containing protein n=1 Tax=Oedothorax gibbosus TaxID=931172 RepID=A0AAV6VS30_9ARAC|nr:hypothetical protein JTE90_026471 [Oedothorax gibbosus]